MRARSAYPRGLCPRAPRIPLAAPDGGRTCSPVTHPFGHQLPGSLPQRIAEVCPLPTRIALSYLTDLARDRDRRAARPGRECSQGAGRLPPAGGSVGRHIRPAVATVTYLKFAARSGPGLRVSGPAPAAFWLRPPAGPGALPRNVRTVEVPRAIASTPNGSSLSRGRRFSGEFRPGRGGRGGGGCWRPGISMLTRRRSFQSSAANPLVPGGVAA